MCYSNIRYSYITVIVRGTLIVTIKVICTVTRVCYCTVIVIFTLIVTIIVTVTVIVIVTIIFVTILVSVMLSYNCCNSYSCIYRCMVLMLLCLLQTRFEAQKSQMEAEFRLSLEQQINERLTAIQEENTTHNTQLRQQHRYTHH